MNRSAKVPKLKCADRLEYFKLLAVDKNSEVDIEVMNAVAEDYPKFCAFCDEAHENKAKKISIEVDGNKATYSIL